MDEMFKLFYIESTKGDCELVVTLFFFFKTAVSYCTIEGNL